MPGSAAHCTYTLVNTITCPSPTWTWRFELYIPCPFWTWDPSHACLIYHDGPIGQVFALHVWRYFCSFSTDQSERAGVKVRRRRGCGGATMIPPHLEILLWYSMKSLDQSSSWSDPNITLSPTLMHLQNPDRVVLNPSYLIHHGAICPTRTNISMPTPYSLVSDHHVGERQTCMLLWEPRLCIQNVRQPCNGSSLSQYPECLRPDLSQRPWNHSYISTSIDGYTRGSTAADTPVLHHEPPVKVGWLVQQAIYPDFFVPRRTCVLAQSHPWQQRAVTWESFLDGTQYHKMVRSLKLRSGWGFLCQTVSRNSAPINPNILVYQYLLAARSCKCLVTTPILDYYVYL